MRFVRMSLLITLLVVGGIMSSVAAPKAVLPQSDISAPAPGVNLDQLHKKVSLAPTPILPSINKYGGFGDPYNSYAWAMGIFKGDLFVGTGRFTDTFHPMWEGVWGGMGTGMPPEHLPDTPYAPFMQDFLYPSFKPAVFQEWNGYSHAEIWRYSARTRTWGLVFRAKDIAAKIPGQVASEAMGFRKMEVFTDSKGASALFAFVGGLSYADPNKACLIYRSANGTDWTGIPTPKEMGTQTRASTVHNGALYVGVLSPTGPQVWYTKSSNPTAPKSGGWKLVFDLGKSNTNLITDEDKANTGIISMMSYRGKLYVGTENSKYGFQVWVGSGAPGKYDWKKIVTSGGVDRYNVWAATMIVFKDQLLVGSIGIPYITGSDSIKGFDIFAIDAKNKWKLLVGGGMPANPVAGFENVRSESGYYSGFGNPMNFYCWSMQEFGGKLYVGTFDASIFFRYLKDYTGPLPPEFAALAKYLPYLATGADLWQTADGKVWLPVSLNGLGHQDNYGLRNMLVYQNNLVIGTSNPFDGCEIHMLSPYDLVNWR